MRRAAPHKSSIAQSSTIQICVLAHKPKGCPVALGTALQHMNAAALRQWSDAQRTAKRQHRATTVLGGRGIKNACTHAHAVQVQVRMMRRRQHNRATAGRKGSKRKVRKGSNACAVHACPGPCHSAVWWWRSAPAGPPPHPCRLPTQVLGLHWTSACRSHPHAPTMHTCTHTLQGHDDKQVLQAVPPHLLTHANCAHCRPGAWAAATPPGWVGGWGGGGVGAGGVAPPWRSSSTLSLLANNDTRPESLQPTPPLHDAQAPPWTPTPPALAGSGHVRGKTGEGAGGSAAWHQNTTPQDGGN